MPLLNLPSVTVCAVDTRTPELALRALRRSMASIRFGDAVLLTAASQLGAIDATDLRIEPIRAITSTEDYSRFMLLELLDHVRTEHVLVVQWDGFVLDASQWDPAFLDCDYIGAIWPDAAPGFEVGNGGFSLRSRRLMQALLDPTLCVQHPEDVAIGRLNRRRLEQEHSIRFASVDLASHFSYEREAPRGPTFGFHGLFNFFRFMEPHDLLPLIESLPKTMYRGLDMHDLARSLLRLNRVVEAHTIISSRLALGMRDRRTLRLLCRLKWQELLGRAAPRRP